MRKHNRSNRGFTLMETLIVVGIIGVLAALSFVAVINYRRGLKQRELDETACEIFVAAQNHLTMAKSQGTLDAREDDPSVLGVSHTRKESNGKATTYHYFFYDPSAEGDDNPLKRGTVLYDMLPQFSLDDTVRTGGSYVIEYDLDNATVTNVFYSDQSDMSNVQFSDADYNALFTPEGGLTGEERKGDRLAGLREGDPNTIIGWYGGEDGKALARTKLYAPRVEVINEECLAVKISFSTQALNKMTKNGGSDAIIQLIIEGETSRNSRVINLSAGGGRSGEELGTFVVTSQSEVSGRSSRRYKTYILDDITQEDGKGHFAKKWCEGSDPLIPGEDIKVTAKVFSNTVLANIPETASQVTNSLFKTATVSPDATPQCTIEIANFRHLENLNKSISGFDQKGLQVTEPGAINVTQNSGTGVIGVTQTSDMVWIDNATSSTAFLNKIYDNKMRKKGAETKPEEVKVWSLGGTDYKAGTYAPVNMKDAVSYDGGDHSISNVKVEVEDNAGIFGMDQNGLSVKDLEIRDSTIVSTGSGKFAGALIGQSIGSISITNVLVHDTVGATPSKVSSAGGSGGLVGMVMSSGRNGSVVIDSCAASVYVQATATTNPTQASAGGLIGMAGANSPTDTLIIKNSYTGGHTKEGMYDQSAMNVVSSGVAGGLVGTSEVAQISYCYSTASVSAPSAAGGLVGTIKGGSVANCYATGAVGGPTTSSGGVIGSVHADATQTFTNNYWLANSVSNAVGGVQDAAGFTAITDSFLPMEDARANALPYDSVVSEQFKDKYEYRTILQLYAEGDANRPAETRITNAHYGDWEIIQAEPQLFITDVNAENHYIIVRDDDYSVESEAAAKQYGARGLVRLTYTSLDKNGNAISYTRELHPEAAYNATLNGKSATRSNSNNRGSANYQDCGFETGQFCKAYTENYTDEEGNAKTRKYYYVLIDSITTTAEQSQNGHASDRFPGFAPGCDIKVEAALVKSASYAEKQAELASTNSIFNSIEYTGTTVEKNGVERPVCIVHVANARQLQNMSDKFSSFSNEAVSTYIRINGLEFDEDVIWDEVDNLADEQGDLSFWAGTKNCIERTFTSGAPDNFISSFNDWCVGSTRQWALDNTASMTFYPLYELNRDPNNTGIGSFTLEGNSKRMLNFTFGSDYQNKYSGLFALSHKNMQLTFQDLFMVNPATDESTQITGMAGSFIGKVGETDEKSTGSLTMRNCGAYMSSGDEYQKGSFNLTTLDKNDTESGRRIYVRVGQAGGLIGCQASTANISDTFASVPVMSGYLGNAEKTSAGGLIGWTQNIYGTTKLPITLQNSYTGGYIPPDATNGKNEHLYDPTCVGIVSFTTYDASQPGQAAGGVGAGGVIGLNDKKGATYKNVFSTASVASNNESGGFIGHSGVATATSYSDCYCLGTVYYPDTSKPEGQAIAGGGGNSRSGVFCVANNSDAKNFLAAFKEGANNYAYGLSNTVYAKTVTGITHPDTSLGQEAEGVLAQYGGSSTFVPYSPDDVPTERLFADHDDQNGVDATTETFSYSMGADYPYRVVTSAGQGVIPANGSTASGSGDYTFVGDWPYINLDANATVQVNNADKLTASITFPKEDVGVAARINVLVMGETSKKGAYLRLEITPNEAGSGYEVSVVTPENTYDSAVTSLGADEASQAKWQNNVRLIDEGGANIKLEFTLDDITSLGGHFATRFAGTGLLPGENINLIVDGGEKSVARLKTYANNGQHTSDQKVAKTNGLFADESTAQGNSISAGIAYIRHLQNLDPAISGVSDKVTKANVLQNLTWSSQEGKYPNIFAKDATLENNTKKTTASFYGIYNPNLESLDGNNHVLKNFVIVAAPEGISSTGSNNAGLFRLVDNGMELKNVKLDGIDVHSMSGHAGAAVAEVTGTGATLNTVLAIAPSTKVIQATGDSYAAGGLVGSIDVDLGQSVAIKNSAATILVSAQGAAGGLIGQQLVGQVTVEQSYAGGHTVGAAYSHTSYNVTSSSAAAGGIIGHVAGGSLSATYSFTAASVSGTAAAGGVLGKVDVPVSLQMAYVIAPVDGITSSEADGKHGAFAGIIAEDVTVTNTQTYYLPEIYSGLVQGEITSESIPLVGGGLGTLSESVNLGYYGDSANDISARTHQDTMQIKTYPYDATLMGTSNTGEREYPFSIWTEFEFDNRIRNRVEGKTYGVYYGDWQPVLTPATVLHTINFMYEDPRFEDTVNPVEDEDLGTQSLREGRDNKILLPGLPYFAGYEVAYWELDGITDNEGNPVTLTSSGGYLTIPTQYCSSDLTAIARYAVTDGYRITFYYDKTGANTNFEQIGQAQVVDEGTLMSSITVPERSITGYRIVGWYADKEFTQPLDFTQDTPVTADIKAYAKYEEIEYYTITIDFMYETGTGEAQHLNSIPRYRVDDTPQYVIKKAVGDTFDEDIPLPASTSSLGIKSWEPYEGSSGTITCDEENRTIHVTANESSSFLVLFTGGSQTGYHYTIRYRFHDSKATQNDAVATPIGSAYNEDYAFPAGLVYKHNEVYTYNPYAGHDDGADFTAPLGTTPDIRTDTYAGFTAPSVQRMSIGTVEENNVIYVDYYRRTYVLTFDSKSGSYVEPVQLAYGQLLSERKPSSNPTRTGYAFDTGAGSDGWTITKMNGTGSYTWPDAMPNANLKATANWKRSDNTRYTVVYWKQRADNNVDATDDEKTYDYEDMETRTGTTGARANLESSDKYKSYVGFTFNERVSDDGKIIAADGSTVLNVYYDRNPHTLYFYINSSDYTYTATDATTGTLYGWIGDQYVELTRGPQLEGFTYTRTNGNTIPQYGKVDGTYVELEAVEDAATYAWSAVNTYSSTTSTSGTQYALVDGEYVQLTSVSTDNYTIPSLEKVLSGSSSYYYIVDDNNVLTEQYLYRHNNRWYKSWSWGVYSNRYTGDVYDAYEDVTYVGVRYSKSGNTFQQNNNGTYGMFDGHYISLTKSSSPTITWYLNDAVYTQTRYTRNASSTYTGQRYTRTGDTPPYTYTATSDNDASPQYGVDSNGGHVLIQRGELQDVWYTWFYDGQEYTGNRYTRSNTTGYIWTYTLNGQTYNYTGQRYTRSNRISSGNYNKLVYTIRGLYGQQVGKYFDAGTDPLGTTYASYCWEDIGTPQVYGYVLKSIELMPDSDVYLSGAEMGTQKTIYYYTEALPGETGQTRTFRDRKYVLYKTIKHNFNYLTFDEEFHPIEGFDRSRSNADPAFGIYNQASIGSGNVNYLYYTRNSYKLSFFDTLENTEFDATGQSDDLEAQTVPYQQGFSLYKPADSVVPVTKRSNEGYAWDGKWYKDQACTTEFDWEDTMPSRNVVVYLKFELPYHDVSFSINDPDPDTGEPAHYMADADAYTFHIEQNKDLGSVVADDEGNLRPEFTPVKEGYIFDGWYYTEGGQEKPFINSMGIQSDMEVYAKWTQEGSTEERTVKVHYLDMDGNPILKDASDNEIVDELGPYSVGTVAHIPSRDIAGYYADAAERALTVLDEDDNSVTFYYTKIEPWIYKVEYYARYRSYEDAEDAGEGIEPKAHVYDYLIREDAHNEAFNHYETISFAMPEGFENYHLDHYEYGDTTNGKGTLVTIHPEGTGEVRATVRFIIEPDTSTISLSNRYAKYDGTQKAIEEEQDTQNVFAAPSADATVQVWDTYRYYDGSGEHIDADQVVNAGMYPFDTYLVLRVQGAASRIDGVASDESSTERAFLLWKDTEGHYSLRIARRSVTLTSQSGIASYDPNEVVESRDYSDIAVGKDGFASGEGVDCHFTVEAFRKDRGTSDNSFTYTFWSNTSPENYDITTVFGTLTVVVKTNYTEPDDISCGEGIYYVVDGDVNNPDEGLSLVFDKRSDDVTTPIEMPNFASTDDVPWTQYDREQLGEIASIDLNGCYSTIGDNAFAGLTGLASIAVPEGVTVIGGSAFAGDTALATVTLPDGLLSIGPSAFAGNTSLTGIEIPSSVTAIGDSAFAGDSALTTATLPNIEIISANTFANTGLTSIDIPASVTEIGTSAFEGNTALTTVTGLAGVTAIDASAFKGDTALATITLPETLATIGAFAFQGDTTLASIAVPASVTSIGESAFAGDTSLTSVTLPLPSEGQTLTLGAGAFADSGVTTLLKVDGTAYSKETDEEALATLCPEPAEGTEDTLENRIKTVFANTPLVAAWYPEQQDPQEGNNDPNSGNNNQNNNNQNNSGDTPAPVSGESIPMTVLSNPTSLEQSIGVEPLTVVSQVASSVEQLESEPETELTEEELKAQELEAAFVDVLTDTDVVVTKSELGDYLYYALVHNDDDVVIRDENDEEVERVKGYTLMLVAREPHEGEEPESMKYRVPDYDDPQGTFDETYEPKRVPWASFSGTDSDSHEYNEYDFRPYITRVVLDDRITDVGDYAFSDLTALSTITLPRDIERIGKGAFANGGAHGLTEAWPYKPKDMTPEQEEEYKAYTTPQLADLSRADLIDPDETDETKLAEQRESALALTDEEALGRAFADTPLFKVAYPTA